MGKMIGRGWPDPTEPGLPSNMTEDGFHWMAWGASGTVTIGHWSSNLWCWVISYHGEFVGAEEMEHLDYLGPAAPPRSPFPNERARCDFVPPRQRRRSERG